MAVSDKIRAALALVEKKNVELAEYWGITPQSLHNKMSRGSFSARDLIGVADFVGARLAFVFPDGQTLYFDPAEKAQKSTTQDDPER